MSALFSFPTLTKGMAYLLTGRWCGRLAPRQVPPKIPRGIAAKRHIGERRATLHGVEIETKRLIMRPASAEDVEDLVGLHEDALVREVFGSPTRAEIEEWVGRAEDEWAERGHGRVTLLDREDGGFLGRCGLKWWPEFSEVEVGWVLTPAARGRGIATEAGRACVEWGFRDFPLPYVTAYIAPDNNASIAVARRLGMTPLREDVLQDVPVVVYALQRAG
jgi:RimJ/RimL family protein N-acetyltransferase